MMAALLMAAAAAAWNPFAARDTAGLAKLERGRAVYENNCVICHGAERDHPGTTSLGFKYGGDKPAVLDQRTDLTPEVVKFYVRNGVAMMPFFRKTELGDEDLDALAAYLSRKR